jgi:hypothetical protein
MIIVAALRLFIERVLSDVRHSLPGV